MRWQWRCLNRKMRLTRDGGSLFHESVFFHVLRPHHRFCMITDSLNWTSSGAREYPLDSVSDGRLPVLLWPFWYHLALIYYLLIKDFQQMHELECLVHVTKIYTHWIACNDTVYAEADAYMPTRFYDVYRCTLTVKHVQSNTPCTAFHIQQNITSLTKTSTLASRLCFCLGLSVCLLVGLFVSVSSIN